MGKTNVTMELDQMYPTPQSTMANQDRKAMRRLKRLLLVWVVLFLAVMIYCFFLQ